MAHFQYNLRKRTCDYCGQKMTRRRNPDSEPFGFRHGNALFKVCCRECRDKLIKYIEEDDSTEE